MLNFIKNFRKDEDGAVTVDFVVLTAALVILGLLVGTALTRGATDLAGEIRSELEAADVPNINDSLNP